MANSFPDSSRLLRLRSALQKAGADGFILPLTDEYQGEYSADYARRVTWLTGFDGSAGQVAITPGKAALFIDSRYTLQAAREVDPVVYQIYDSAEVSAGEWLAAELNEDATIAYDPMLYTRRQLEALEARISARNITPLPVTPNPVDALWDDQPERPTRPVRVHPSEYAGASHTEKRQQISSELRKSSVDAYLLTQPDAICWLLNIRGADIPYNPLPLCYALMHVDGSVDLFIAPESVSSEVKKHLGNEIRLHAPETLEEFLKTYGEKECLAGYESATCPAQLPTWLEEGGSQTKPAKNPVTLAKAIKNNMEIEGMRRAHLHDGVAATRFLCWFDGLEGPTDELEVVGRLERYREQCPDYLGPSFATIAGSGEHGAIVHYRADEQSNRSITSGDVLLLDSGGQYPFGTTDITRTVVLGDTVQPEFKDRFTRVLKGHIALAQAQFPEGTSGTQLDLLARQPLWDAGLDYGHGTGHGVGCHLCVHEGPQRISKRGGDVPLQPSMILSNEPGYYREGAYGIRIENLVLVVEREVSEGTRYFGFNTLTLAPIDTRLIMPQLLGEHERAWLNHYHQRVLEALSPHLDSYEIEWLNERCAAI